MCIRDRIRILLLAFQRATDVVRTLPLVSKDWFKKWICRFVNKTQFLLNKVCYKVSLGENVRRQSYSIGLSISYLTAHGCWPGLEVGRYGISPLLSGPRPYRYDVGRSACKGNKRDHSIQKPHQWFHNSIMESLVKRTRLIDRWPVSTSDRGNANGNRTLTEDGMLTFFPRDAVMIVRC